MSDTDIALRQRELMERLNDIRRQIERLDTKEYPASTDLVHTSGAETVAGVKTFTSNLLTAVLAARSAAGLRGEDDGSNLGWFVQDATGYVGILNATPGYALDIKVNALRSQMHFSGTNADSGGYMVSASANNFFMSGGAHFEAGPWVAKSTSAGIFGTQLGHFDWFADTGLTAGNNFTPTQLMYLDAAGLGIGSTVTAPKGKLHVHDGTGGSMHVSKTGIVGSAQVIIPNATGDVVSGVWIKGVLTNAASQVIGMDYFLLNGNTHDETADAGTNSLRFTANANGELSVIRQAGSSTWAVTLHLIWK